VAQIARPQVLVALAIGGLLATLIALLLAAGPASSAVPVTQGDANCDGVVAADDAIPALLVMAGLAPPDGECTATGADIDCSGDIDPLDVAALLYYVALSRPTTAPTATPVGCPQIGAPFPTPIPTECPAPQGHTGEPTAADATPLAGAYDMRELPADAGFLLLSAIMPLPGTDEVIISTQDGVLYRVCLTAPIPAATFGDITDRVNREGDEGVGGMVLDPDNPSVLYINYTRGDRYYRPPSPTPLDPKRNRISRFAVVGEALDEDSEQTILEVLQPHTWHNVNHLAFGPDGYLYISSGDGGRHQWANGQTLNDLLGAVLRIDVNGPNASPYAVPADNPFHDGDGPNADELWAIGFRNPWRFSFDEVTDTMWIGDVGEFDWEEVNVGQSGGNYGWPNTQGFDCFPTPTPPLPTSPGQSPPLATSPGQSPTLTPTPTASPTGSPSATPLKECAEDTVLPRVVYPHNQGCAIVAGYVYHGTEMPELEGYFIYGDFCSGRVWALEATDPESQPVLLLNTDIRLTSFAVTEAGELIGLNLDGGIYKLERTP